MTADRIAALVSSPFAAVESALDPAADQAQAIAVIFHAMLWVCGVMYVAVLLGLAAVVWRRRLLRREPGAAAVRDSTLTRGLTGWVVAIVIGLTGLTATSYVVDRRLIPEGPAALHVRVTGHEWWWEIEYIDADPSQTFLTANELHLPSDRKAFVELASADVIHSFWVPNLSGKRDAIPGRVNLIELTPRRAGEFRGNCAEFCGVQHAKMALYAIVDDPEAYEAWRRGQAAPARTPDSDLLRKGQQAFIGAECTLCHQVRGTDAASHAGPDLTHLASRRTLAAGTLPMNPGSLARWIADPQAYKPGNHMPRVVLTDAARNEIVFYLMSLQ